MDYAGGGGCGVEYEVKRFVINIWFSLSEGACTRRCLTLVDTLPK